MDKIFGVMLDLFAVELGADDAHLMAAFAEFDAQHQARVQIAKRAQGCEGDFLAMDAVSLVHSTLGAR
jgi:hypothetical protein